MTYKNDAQYILITMVRCQVTAAELMGLSELTSVVVGVRALSHTVPTAPLHAKHKCEFAKSGREHAFSHQKNERNLCVLLHA